MAETITIDTILDHLQAAIEEKLPLSPYVWVDGASKLNVLLGSEHDAYCELESAVASLQLAFLDADEKRNVSAAKAKVKAHPVYMAMRKSELKIKRVEEFIRLAKLKGRLLDTERRSN